VLVSGQSEADLEQATMGDYFPSSRYFAGKEDYDREVGCLAG
jgi:hypothetical protein